MDENKNRIFELAYDKKCGQLVEIESLQDDRCTGFGGKKQQSLDRHQDYPVEGDN
jgi:hypothetical protein